MTSKALLVSKLCLGLLAIALLAAAQSSDVVAVRIPYEVHVATVTVPAGDYTVSVVRTGSDSQVVEFHSAGGFVAVVLANRVPAPDDWGDKTELVLTLQNGVYRLNRIWIGGRSYGYEFPHHEHK